MAKTDKKIRIFSALEVANICGVVNQTAINWIKNGYLKAFTTPGGQYRVYSDDLVRFLHSRGMRMPEELQQLLAEQMTLSSLIIIEDDRELSDTIKRALAERYPSFTVHQAFDGFDAGRIVAEVKPGVVVLDIDLPELDGYQLCRRIREDTNLGNPIVVALCGSQDAAEHERITEAGADALVTRPLDIGALADTIDGLIRKRG
ncbi:MAG: response regulator [Spirochaetaceae bacterium]|nr:MAG: response regulator [Spirochaetaceae bacterium]